MRIEKTGTVVIHQDSIEMNGFEFTLDEGEDFDPAKATAMVYEYVGERTKSELASGNFTIIGKPEFRYISKV